MIDRNFNKLIPSFMDILSVFNIYKNQKKCIKHLEKVRWDGEVKCVYCGSDRITPVKAELRHKCGACGKSFSVTVGTIYHDTRLPLQKWFLATAIILNAKKGISARELARQIKVNKDTAWRMEMKIREAMKDDEQAALFSGIVECDECYVGGKKKKGDKKKDDDDNFINPRGRATQKQGVIGVVERATGRVKIQKQDKFKFTDIKAFLEKHLDFGNTHLYTDDFKGYIPFKRLLQHSTVNHSQGEYTRGDVHTNTIEGFWGIFKRAFIGSYHQLSKKYLERYIEECCFKYNNRNNPNTFDLIIKNCVTL